ncbi:MAG: hypothetical protein WD468_03305 [Pirellulales bacterium]
MTQTQIPIATVQKLRQCAQECLLRPCDVPPGWSIMPMDLDGVLDVFPSLRLKLGYTLVGYLFNRGDGGHGAVYAVPTGTTLLDPMDWTEEQIEAAWGDLHYRPPPPTVALPDVMEAIEGDHSSMSYFEASLLRRELHECGAFWHALRWATEEILGCDPFADPIRREEMVVEGERRERMLRRYPPGHTPDWQWSEPKPTAWGPTVQESTSGQVQVTFYTHSTLGQHRITQHRDTYCDGTYRHEGECVVIGRGPMGRIF